jgi:ABC-type bacteriocin/lantibiotic exporter with double-glycine peptidase domain
VPRRLLQIPHYEQTEESDCLAACARMALEAIGESIPYSELLSVLDIKPWGTPHRNIRKLEEIVRNVHVIYRQGELTELFASLDAGFAPIAFVWTGELPYWSVAAWHAVLIVGYDEEYFYVQDPAFENVPIQVSQGDLDLAWLAYDSFYAIVEKA